MPEFNPIVPRRQFLQTAAGAGLAGGWVRRVLAGAGETRRGDGEVARFGVIADPHHGLQPDAQRRLDAFMADVLKRDDLDFIIQLGDFCHPDEAAAPFVESFDRFAGPRYHVLGNHDMDKGTKDDALKRWGAAAPYYSFDAGPYHFVVLDFNNLRDGETFTPYDTANFYVDGARRAWTDTEQRSWLAADLAKTTRPTIVFGHQPIGIFSPNRDDPPPQQRQVLDILRDAHERDDAANIVAAMSGHLHVDRVERQHGFHCISINSASYHWSEGRQEYRDPLYAFVTAHDDGTVVIDGRATEFVEAHPQERGLSVGVKGVSATISDRRLGD